VAIRGTTLERGRRSVTSWEQDRGGDCDLIGAPNQGVLHVKTLRCGSVQTRGA